MKDLDLSGAGAKSEETKSPRRGSIGMASDSESKDGLDSGRETKKGLGAHLAKREGTLGKKKHSTFDEEQMLDIAEACFIRMAELML